MITIALFVAIFIARFFVKDKTSYERRVYEYCLTFGNYGYVGAPLVIALFGMRGYSFLSFITLPCTVLVYTWGISALVPNGEKKLSTKEKVKRMLNVPTIAVFAGVLFGITGLGKVLYQTPALTFITNCISDLGDCMVPTAMLLAGITVAKYDFKKTVSNKKVYLASLLRLILIPTVLVSIMYGIITLSNLRGINFDKSFLYLAFFVCATPPGLNIVVFPEAFGGDTSLSASFILVSYVLCVVTIPLMFAILSVFLGPLPIF